MINTQQLIVLMPLFNVQMPANIQAFFNQIIKIATFDIVSIEPYIVWVLKVNDTEALTPNFEALGFGSMYFLNNMGAMILGFIIYFVGIIFLAILDCFNPKYQAVAKRSESIRATLFYNYIIGMMNESYSQISVCAFIGFYYMKFNSYGNTI